MSYLVLARKYRPQVFSDIVGQDHLIKTLTNAISIGRVAHAYLLCGPRGVGKTTAARILAKALNCEQGPTPVPCNTCSACVEITEGRSMDVLEIDGASNRGINEVRELRENVRYAPSGGRSKVYIIDEVHMLTTEAFNALLKTLEEPPPHVVFIFATTEPHKIPATIHSRCQRFDFKRVSAPALVKHLSELCARESVEVDQTGLSLIARAAEGSVRDALSLLDQVIAYHAAAKAISADKVAEVLGVADRRVLFELSRAILSRDAQSALSVVDRLFEGGQDLPQFSQAFLSHLRDLTVARTCKEPAPLVDATEAELSELISQAGADGADLLPQHFDHFARVTEEVARSSFPRLLLEMAVIEMINAQPLLPLGDLLERLERMEARVGSSGGGFPASGGTPRFSGTGAAKRPRTTARGKQAPSTPPPAAPPRESQASPPAGGGNGHSIEGWQRLLEGVMEREPVAASAFAAGKLIRWRDDAVVLGYASDSFELQWAKDPQKLRAFEAACSQQAQRKITVEIRELSADEEASPEVMKASAFQERQRKTADRKRALREEAEGHPVTRKLVENFGAKIDGITTEADET
jgi:DNA polymerase-3 subunit gamma/tau